MRRAYQDLVEMQICALTPVIVLLVLFAEPLVVLIYGEKWIAGARILQALVFVMLGSGLYQMNVPYMMAGGHFKLIARTKLLEMVVFLPCAYLGVRFWGLTGLAVGAGIGYLTSALVLTSFVPKVGGPRVRWARLVGTAALSTAPSMLVAGLVQVLFEGPQVVETLLILVTFGGTYLVVLMLFRRSLLTRILDLVLGGLPGRAEVASALRGRAGSAEGMAGETYWSG
jgi:PST family polysaccharide transporter